MDRQDYIMQMKALLNDQSTYRKLNRNPLNKITSQLNCLVKSWKNNGIIDARAYNFLNCTNGNLPRCYGLPKIHKEGYPLRIIVSAVGSPLYNIASYPHNILNKAVVKPSSHVKDSWSFVESMKQHSIPPDHVLVSLDVVALFTNIPIELVLTGIEKRWDAISGETRMNLDQFLHAIRMILNSTSFSFDGEFYEQIFGSPMGSPLSPILADIVMDDLETCCLQSFDFHIEIFLRYVDDIFMCIPQSKLNEVVRTFNNYHPRLKFTYELEKNNTLNFLNTSVFRHGNCLFTNWYRKPTFSGRYINFFSSHPLKYKINTVINLVDQAILLSDEQFHDENIKLVKTILSNNCFPDLLVNKHIQRRISEINKRSNNEDSASNEDSAFTLDLKNYVPIPYVKTFSEGLRRTFKNYGLNTLYTVPKKMDTLIRKGKDKLEIKRCTDVVYKLDCSDCNACYIGQTKRHLETRIKEHRADIKKPPNQHSVVIFRPSHETVVFFRPATNFI
ncbi:uncharacterized protein [Temnothorax longispinosus]|uniref:uncharacterized protein n=1 Tax=Temnothorax longispinosus TaxID=300112 RepID=UPI003A99C514